MRARVQPGVPAAQPDQLLVQREGGQPQRGELLRGGGERRADGVVPAGAVLLDAAEGVLVAGVDRRGAADGREHHQRVREVRGSVSRLAMRVTSWLPRNVYGTKRCTNVVVPAQRVGELVQVRVVERAPDRLPQLVLGDRVQPALGDEARVVAVDDLAHRGRRRGAGPARGRRPGPRTPSARRTRRRAASRRRRGRASGVMTSTTWSTTAGLPWSSATREAWPSKSSYSGSTPGRHASARRASAAGTRTRSARPGPARGPPGTPGGCGRRG